MKEGSASRKFAIKRLALMKFHWLGSILLSWVIRRRSGCQRLPKMTFLTPLRTILVDSVWWIQLR